MIKKCINCCKWITCKNNSENKRDCENFKFKKIEIKEKENDKQIK